MTDPLIHLIALLITFVVATLSRHRWNAALLTGSGAVFLWILSPLAAVFVAAMGVEAIILVYALKLRPRNDAWRKYLPYILLPNFLFVDFHSDLLGFNIQTLAISFSTIRIFMTTKQLLSCRTPVRVADAPWLFVAGFYLPALIVGPVFSATTLRDQETSGSMASIDLSAHTNLLLGLILALLVSPTLVNCAILAGAIGPYGLPLEMVFRFLNLFAAFWGQSLIAEQSARFFGHSIPQNFDKPWLARDIREFWARWHRSMAQFVTQYIYLPLTLKKVPARVATIGAFLFMGIWHNLSLGYAIWGAAHGILLAYWPTGERARRFVVLERAVLVIAVVGLSYTANYAGV
ncbi:MAG: MBOAT family O-acyltransferase [Pseudomonadota bacterium]